MPDESLIRALLLPERSLLSFRPIPTARVVEVVAEKHRKRELCPRCASPSEVGYDRRVVRLKDENFRGYRVQLVVRKRRLWCQPCGKPFTEPLQGVRKGFQHTERYGSAALRLLDLALTQRRIEVTGDRRSMAIQRLLLRNGHSLDFWKELDVQRFLDAHPALREVYLAKEALHLPELATLRRTLAKWRDEVLAYFDTGLTNAITEGFNLKAKLVKRRAFGYRSFRNYRLRLLNACDS